MEQGKRAYCNTCDRMRLFVKHDNDNHWQIVLHAALSLITCGLWFPVGVIIYAATMNSYKCRNCGEELR